jgi:hypothetical protein
MIPAIASCSCLVYVKAAYANLVEHGFFKGQFDLASKPLGNPNC